MTTPNHLPRRVLLAGSLSIATVGSTVSVASAESCASGCFTKADNDRLKFPVLQATSPPADDSVDCDFGFWPCTATKTLKDFSHSTWSGDKWQFVWANRNTAIRELHPNPLPPPAVNASTGESCAMEFTTWDAANAATQSYLRYSLGMDNFAEPWIAAGGSADDFLSVSELRADPDRYFVHRLTVNDRTYATMRDIPILPEFRIVDVAAPAPGIALDYEVHDARSVEDATTFLEALAADAHSVGKEFFLYTNPLSNPGQVYNGLDETNLPHLLQNHLDKLNVLLHPNRPDPDITDNYYAQLDVLRGTSGDEPIPHEKLALNFALGDPATEAEALAVHTIMTDPDRPHPSMLMIFLYGAKLDGPCSSADNRKLGLACFGHHR